MWEKYSNLILDSFTGYFNYLIKEISHPGWTNYFYLLIAASLIVWFMEIANPWRKNQSNIRKDFWLDGFYMFFNFFLFSLVGYNAISTVGVELFKDFLALFDVKNLVAIKLNSFPFWAQLLAMFVIKDFIEWNIHRLLHRVPWLWQFHKVHHSVKEMGFAAHLRFHWMETVVYKTLEYIPLAMLGFSIEQFFIIHAIAIIIGHLNHANTNIDYGPLKFIFNNPRMHIWHHAKELPDKHKYGVNFGISLSIWDYIFGSAFIPKNGRDIELGFDKDDQFPKDFAQQIIYPLNKKDT